MSTSITVPVFYATSEGHTRRIAEQIALTLRQQGLDNRRRARRALGSRPRRRLRGAELSALAARFYAGEVPTPRVSGRESPGMKAACMTAEAIGDV